MSTLETDNDLLSRAMSAYYAMAGKQGGLVDQPANTSGVCEHDGLRYVVLRNANGILAVYRILNSGVLKRLKRHPFTEVDADTLIHARRHKAMIAYAKETDAYLREYAKEKSE